MSTGKYSVYKGCFFQAFHAYESFKHEVLKLYWQNMLQFYCLQTKAKVVLTWSQKVPFIKCHGNDLYHQFHKGNLCESIFWKCFFFFFSLLLSAWNISSWIYTLWIWLCPWTTKILMLVHLLTVNFELIFRIQKARSYSFNLAPNPFKGNFPTRFTIPFLHLR